MCEMFGWSDEEWGRHPRSFCDWAIAFDDMQQNVRRRDG